MVYEIRVFGGEDWYGDAYSDGNGGWALHVRTSSFEDAEAELREAIEEFGWDDVSWDWDSPVGAELSPEFVIEECDRWELEEGFDPYMGCYSYDC